MPRRRRRRDLWVIALALAAGAAFPAAGHGLDARAKANVEAFEKDGAIRTWTRRAWSQAYVHRTRHYEIRTNTSLTTAKYMGRLMEMTADRYRNIFDYAHGHIPRLSVYAYATQEEFYQDALHGMANPNIGGFYSWKGLGAIYLPYIEIHGHPPSITLFHEGTHQFVHEVLDYRVPLAYQKAFEKACPGDRPILPSVPVWLNEGLATYMETARYDGEGIEVGRVNAPRLYHLQQLLKTKTNPPLSELVSRRYGQPFASAHYAMAWGVVYALRHDWRVEERDRNRQKLVEYIETARRAFWHAPDWEFKKQMTNGDDLVDNFDIKWRVHIGDSSRKAFEKIIVGSSMTIEEWEQAWAERILAMDPRQPYGGTRRGEAALDKGDDRLRR